MSIRSNKARADALAAEAEAERCARRRHAARAMAIIRRRAGSPLGLAVCFGAGAAAGWRKDGPDDASGEQDQGDEDKNLLKRLFDGPVGHIALRLAATALIQSLMQSGGTPTADAPGDEIGEAAEAF